MEDTAIGDLFEKLERERRIADRLYNDALTTLDRALRKPPDFPALPALHDASQVQRLNRGWRVLPDVVPSAGRSLKERLRAFIWRLVAPPLQAQEEFNATVVDHINRNVAVHERAARAAAALVEAATHELAAIVRFEWLLLQFLQTITGYVDTKDRSAAGPEIREQLALVQRRLAVLERDMARKPGAPEAGPGRVTTARSTSERSSADVTPPEQGASGGFAELGSALYVGFEDRFRGAPRTIRERLEPYMPIFSGSSDVVDIGCGRGELLELLRDRGVTARGVDTNQAMVDECRARGLAVERADAQSFLEDQPDGSLGGLIAIQVVEHFEPGYLLRVLELAYRKLRRGAPLVLETINPACWMAFFETYIRDLTHARPLHPDTLRFLVQASGFGSVNVEYRQPVTEADRLERVAPPAGADDTTLALAAAVNAHADKLNARLFSSMDYAIIARR